MPAGIATPLYIRNRTPAEAAWRGLPIGRDQFPCRHSPAAESPRKSWLHDTDSMRPRPAHAVATPRFGWPAPLNPPSVRQSP